MPTYQGAPVSVATTGVVANTSDITNWDFQPGHNINEYKAGSSAYGRKTIGSLQATIAITTTDRAFASKFVKGMKLDGVTVTAKSARTTVSAAGVVGGDSTTYTFSIVSTGSTGGVYVSEPVASTNDATGKPCEWTITFKACQMANGGAPTVTVN